MIYTKCCKKVVQTTLRHLNSHPSANPSVSYCNYTRSKLLRTLLPNVVQGRHIVSEPSNQSNNEIAIPPLFEQPKYVYPSIMKSIKNQLSIGFLLPRLDKDFNLREFMKGTKQALVVVSDALAREDYESIKGLVTDDTIETVRSRISQLNSVQKELLAVRDDDIFLVFPYEVGIMFDTSKGPEKNVEITVVFHSFRDSKNVEEKEIPELLGMNPDSRKNIYISNLRFIREFKQDVESSWTINSINHFMLLSAR